MIELRRPTDSPAADDIAASLRDLVVAFCEIEDDSAEAPTLREGDVTLADPAEIAAFLDQLRKDVAQWNAFQSDACFIEDDGTVC